MSIYAVLLFVCTIVLTYQQNLTGDKHMHGSDHKSYQFGLGWSHSHKHTSANRTFPHTDHVDGRRVHHNLQERDQWDKELLAKLMPLMTAKPQPYLAYLDFWLLTKGKKSKSFDEEKDRFVQFVKKINKHYEHKIEIALGKKSEVAGSSSSSGPGASKGSDLHRIHVHSPGKGPTFESGAARNFSAAGNNVSSGVKPGNFPQLLSNVNDSPGRANGQESPSEVQFNSNLNPIEKIRPTPAVGLQNARKNF